MLLAKRQGGTTVHGHHWKHDDDAVDVPYDLAMELLAIKGADFYVPEPEAGEPPRKAVPKAAVKDEGTPAPKSQPAPPAAKA